MAVVKRRTLPVDRYAQLRIGSGASLIRSSARRKQDTVSIEDIAARNVPCERPDPWIMFPALNAIFLNYLRVAGQVLAIMNRLNSLPFPTTPRRMQLGSSPGVLRDAQMAC